MTCNDNTNEVRNTGTNSRMNEKENATTSPAVSVSAVLQSATPKRISTPVNLIRIGSSVYALPQSPTAMNVTTTSVTASPAVSLVNTVHPTTPMTVLSSLNNSRNVVAVQGSPQTFLPKNVTMSSIAASPEASLVNAVQPTTPKAVLPSLNMFLNAAAVQKSPQTSLPKNATMSSIAASPAVSLVNAVQPTTPKAVNVFRNAAAVQGSPQTSLPKNTVPFSPGTIPAVVLKDANGKTQVIHFKPAVTNASQGTPIKVQPVQLPITNQKTPISIRLNPQIPAGSPASPTISRAVIPKGVAMSPSAISKLLALSQNADVKYASRPPGGGAASRPVIQKGVNVNPNARRNALSQTAIVTANQMKIPFISSPATAVRMSNSVGRGILRPQLLQLNAPGLANHQRLGAPPLRPGVLKQRNSATNIIPQNPRSASSSVLHRTLNPLSTVNGRKRFYLPPSLTSAQEDGTKRFSADSLDDDVIDVAAMGGVNLEEENQRILLSDSDSIGSEIRSCEDEILFMRGPFMANIKKMSVKYGMEGISDEASSLISHAVEAKLRELVEKMGVVAEHRLENLKVQTKYDVSSNVKDQLQFLRDLERLQKKKQEQIEREALLNSSKRRSKLDGPEQRKLREKAKEMQRAERDELLCREMNTTALHALGPAKKKQKTNSGTSGPSQVRPREKYVYIRDLQFVLEQEKDPTFKQILYKSYLK